MSAIPSERCAATGCTRWARETGFCTRHSRPAATDHDEDAERNERRRIFETRLQSGDYRQLFGPDLDSIMRQAAKEVGVDDEIGAIRYALARVLAEETDPLRLAQAVSKLTAASVSAARTRKVITGAAADELTEAITTILLELQP